MAPIGLTLLFLTGVGPLIAWRKASVENLKTQFALPTAAMVLTALVLGGLTSLHGWSEWTVHGVALKFPLTASVMCFSLCALRHHDDRPGVLPRHARPPGAHQARLLHLAHRPGRARQAALRRLPGAHRHRAHVRRLRRRRVQEGEGLHRREGAAGLARPLQPDLPGHHRVVGPRQGHDDRHRRGQARRQAVRDDVPGQVVLPASRGRDADHRGRAAPHAAARICTSCSTASTASRASRT